MVVRIREDATRLKIRVGYITLIGGICLLVVKFVAYFLTDSTAIFSDALESLVNVSAAAFMLASVSVASKPADEKHPYGHGKIEFLSAGFEGAAIIGAAGLIFYQAIRGMISGPEIEYLGAGIIMIGFATAVNAVGGFYLIKIGKKTSSPSLEADGKHLISDVITSVGVLVALALIEVTGIRMFDPAVALLVAINILWMGVKILRRSFGGIMDKADFRDDELIRRVLEDSELKGKVCGFHKVRSRRSGGFTFVDFHLLMPRDIDIDTAHKIATNVEGKIARALEDAGVMAHIEPCRSKDCMNCQVKDCVMRASE